jgi:GDP-D-mannose dehydratase
MLGDVGEVKLKKALLTGITGQDGSHLTELLLDKGIIGKKLHHRVYVNQLFI